MARSSRDRFDGNPSVESENLSAALRVEAGFAHDDSHVISFLSMSHIIIDRNIKMMTQEEGDD